MGRAILESVRGIHIRKVRGTRELRACACLMAGSEPWITLRRTSGQVFDSLKGRSREVSVAVSGREVVGAIAVSMQGVLKGYIQAVCVAPGWRGEGVGRRLVRYAEKRILAETPNVFLCVSSFNRRARKFYEELGYAKVGELKDFVVRDHSEIIMRKSTGPLAGFRTRARR